MPRRKSDLPFGSELSPATINLPEVLEIAKSHEADKEAMENAFQMTYFDERETSEQNKETLAMNLRLSLQNYLILDRELALTDVGNFLYSLRQNTERLYEELAKHILLHLNGLNLVQCVQDMRYAGEKVTLLTLRQALMERGIYFPRGGTHASNMRIWLEKAGVFKRGWRVNESKLQQLIGMASSELDALAQFTPEQKDFLKTLANVGERGPHYSNDIEKLARATYGTQFNEKALPKTVLYPLQEAGYINLTRGTKRPGRGAKPFEVTPTDKIQEGNRRPHPHAV